VPPLTIRLMAQPSGQLANIQMNQRNFQRNFDALNEEILALAGGADAGPGGADALEVEIDADYNLRFEYVIDTITAVSGYVATTPDGRPRIIRLVEKIKFAPPRPDPNQ